MKSRIQMPVVFVIALILIGSAHGAWVAETIVTVGDQGKYASIALDDSDTPHISWYDASNTRLMYGVRDIDGWDIVDIEGPEKGQYSAIAINPTNQMPAIAYYDSGGEEARYAYYDGTWYFEGIQNEDDVLEGQWIDLAFSSTGVPYVSYHYNNGLFHTQGVNVCSKPGASWSGHRLDYRTYGLGDIGTHTAIAMSSAGWPQIAYRDELGGNQMFGWQDGGGWHTENATDPVLDFCGEFVGIDLDGGDNVYISSWDYTTLGDNCASLIYKDAGGWHKDEIECDSGDDFGKYTDIAVEADGTTHITYYGGNELRYAFGLPGAWTIEVPDSGAGMGQWTSIALDSDDMPHIAYYDAGQKNLRYIRDLAPPDVISIDPDEGASGEVVPNTLITGSRFTPDSLASLYHPASDTQIYGTDCVVLDNTMINCEFDLADAWPALWDLRVTNTAGAGTLEDAFTVTTDVPKLTEVDPVEARNSTEDFTMTLIGENFADPMDAVLIGPSRAEIDAVEVIMTSLTEAEAVFDILDAPVGVYDVQVITDYGNAISLGAFEITCGLPKADFRANSTSGDAPLTVQFADQSTDYNDCEIFEWEWDFGDGSVSDLQDPEHIYTEAGSYQVVLTVTSPGGDDEEIKANYIEVTDQPVDDDVDDDADDDADDDEDDDIDPPDDDDSAVIDDDTEEADSGDDDDDDSGGCGC